MLTKIKIFRQFWPKSRFSSILTKIKISVNIDQNRNCSTFFSRIEIFINFDQDRDLHKDSPKSKFLEIWPKSRFFDQFDQIEIFMNFDQNRAFHKYSTKSKFFRNFLTKTAIFANVDRNRNSSKSLTINNI